MVAALAGLVATLLIIVVVAGTITTLAGLVAALTGLARLLASGLQTRSEALGTEASLTLRTATVRAVGTLRVDAGTLCAACTVIISLITRRSVIALTATFTLLILCLC